MKRPRHPRLRKVTKWTGAGLTVLLLVVWAVTGWWYFGMDRYSSDGARIGGVCNGQVFFVHDTSWAGKADDRPWSWFDPIELDESPSWNWGFGFPRRTSSSGSTWTGIWIPIWSLVLLTGVPTVWMFRTDWKLRRNERTGLCRKCGYDLRGQVKESRRTGEQEAGIVCPECGAAATTPDEDQPIRPRPRMAA